MGNGASSSQGSIPSHDRRDVRTSNVKEQHDWQLEQAVAPKQEIQSLPDGRKPYSGAQRGARKSANAIEDSMEPSPPTEKDDSAYGSARVQRRQSLNSPDDRNGKSSVMNDDKLSSVMQDDGSSSAEDEPDDSNGAQQRNQQPSRSHRKSPSPQAESSSSEEDEPEILSRAAETDFLRSRPETTSALTPGQTSFPAKPEADSRLPARHLP